MTLFEVLNAGDAISKIMNLSIPITVAFQLTILHKRLSPEIESFTKQKNDLIKQYGTANEETNEIFVPKDKVEEFNGLLNALTAMEVTVDYPKIKLNDLIPIANIEGKLIYNLYPFLEE